jgi:putative protease
MVTKPELLMPAGDMEKMKYAFAFGADAVYAGVPLFSLRARENDFDIASIKEAVDYAHGIGKKIYLTCNIYAHNNKIKAFMKAMEQMVALKPDAFIMADPGLISLVREKWPEAVIHLSVQANNTNWAQVKFWKKLGIERVILSRELSLKEIKEIHENCPDMELETFVHGAICMAYSGRCLLSNYFSWRDPNQGTCTHSCRWEYDIYENITPEDDVLTTYQPLKGEFFLEEKTRPGEMMEIDEDSYGTYIMNAKDLCAIEYLPQLIDAGVISFKVEGRSKTIYYASIVAKAYREAIDLLAEGKTPDLRKLMTEIESTANRGFIPGFLPENPKHKGEDYEKNYTKQTHLFAAVVREFNPTTMVAKLEIKNRFDLGQELEFVMPDRSFRMTVTELKNAKGESVEHAHGGADDLWMKLSEPVSEYCLARMPYFEPAKLEKAEKSFSQQIA